jgi:hypothetical protein
MDYIKIPGTQASGHAFHMLKCGKHWFPNPSSSKMTWDFIKLDLGHHPIFTDSEFLEVWSRICIIKTVPLMIQGILVQREDSYSVV